MTIRLRDLSACFEGVIPSIIATASAEGTPNISYLSHVALVDDDHVALSNQFFAKTGANVRANPHATLLVVDARDGAQFSLGVIWERALDTGPLFDRVATQLRASSAQIGMGDIMRLKAVDIFRVVSVSTCAPLGGDRQIPLDSRPISLSMLAALLNGVTEKGDADALLEAMLDAARDISGQDHAIILLNDEARGVLTTVASIGYERAGIGSEVPTGTGLIGETATARHPIKVNDMSRVRRFSSAVEASLTNENRTRIISFPSLPDAMSQIAVPMIAYGSVRGILFIESRARMSFGEEQEAALEILARQGATSLALNDALAFDAQPRPSGPSTPPTNDRPIGVVSHSFDDSVFIDNIYVIKGVAGRLLILLLNLYLNEGRSEFTNREIRFADELRLPDLKDNLETRLLLLRRRLEEKGLPIRLIHTGRGRMKLIVDGTLVIEKAG